MEGVGCVNLICMHCTDVTALHHTDVTALRHIAVLFDHFLIYMSVRQWWVLQ